MAGGQREKIEVTSTGARKAEEKKGRPRLGSARGRRHRTAKTKKQKRETWRGGAGNQQEKEKRKGTYPKARAADGIKGFLKKLKKKK